jgi:predicted ArsR family transcriptional regulator
MDDDLGAVAQSIGALADDLRRTMYLFIRRQSEPVSREEAAQEVGISSKLAAFHLDKLVDEGLLKAHYARRPGRSGPGAGRSSKLYEPAEVSFHVSLPPTAYETVGEILIAALETKRPDESPAEAARRISYRAGRKRGQKMASSLSSRRSQSQPILERVEQTLSELGFEPRREAHGITLTNCPFDVLALNNPELVCRLNESFVAGILDAGNSPKLRAILEPKPGRCCVILEEVRQAS